MPLNLAERAFLSAWASRRMSGMLRNETGVSQRLTTSPHMFWFAEGFLDSGAVVLMVCFYSASISSNLRGMTRDALNALLYRCSARRLSKVMSFKNKYPLVGRLKEEDVNCNIGALILRIGFWAHDTIIIIRTPPQSSIGKYLGPCISCVLGFFGFGVRKPPGPDPQHLSARLGIAGSESGKQGFERE